MDSAPTASTASASPASSSMAAAATASPPEAQAVERVRLGPWRPWAMAICAAAMLPKIRGTNRGPTFLWTAVVRLSWVAAVVAMPAMAVPMTMPTRSASAGRPPCRASAAAARAYWVKASLSRSCFPESPSSTSGTWAAIRTARPAGSNRVMGPTAQRSSSRPFQKACTPSPMGVTAPMAVTTIASPMFFSLPGVLPLYKGTVALYNSEYGLFH